MWLNPQLSADFVTFTEKILNGKLHFLCSDKVLRTQGHLGLYKKLCFLRSMRLSISNLSLYKKWSFPLRISPVNVTKSGGNCSVWWVVCFSCSVWDGYERVSTLKSYGRWVWCLSIRSKPFLEVWIVVSFILLKPLAF